jgi:hypothetical protein
LFIRVFHLLFTLIGDFELAAGLATVVACRNPSQFFGASPNVRFCSSPLDATTSAARTRFDFQSNVAPVRASASPSIAAQRQLEPTPIDSDSFDVTLAPASPTIPLEVTSQTPSAERMLYRVPGRLDSDLQEASSVHKVSSMLVLPFSRVTLVSTVESWFPSFHLCIQSRRAYGFSFHTSHRLADPLHLPAQVWRKMEDISNRQNSTLLPGNALDSTQPFQLAVQTSFSILEASNWFENHHTRTLTDATRRRVELLSSHRP